MMGGRSTGSTSRFRFFRFGLIVTGECEENHLPILFRCLLVDGNCNFKVIRRIGQRGPRGPSRQLKMVGEGKTIPDRDQDEIGLEARRFLNEREDSFVILIDDVEWERRNHVEGVFERYRTALDVILLDEKNRASVHFLANMLEAYFYADPIAVKEALGVELKEIEGDVEEIRNPKSKLRKAFAGYNEIHDGGKVLARLDVEKILSRPATCAFLRTLFAWCVKAKGEGFTDRFRLTTGIYSVVTGKQVSGEYEPGIKVP